MLYPWSLPLQLLFSSLELVNVTFNKTIMEHCSLMPLIDSTSFGGYWLIESLFSSSELSGLSEESARTSLSRKPARIFIIVTFRDTSSFIHVRCRPCTSLPLMGLRSFRIQRNSLEYFGIFWTAVWRWMWRNGVLERNYCRYWSCLNLKLQASINLFKFALKFSLVHTQTPTDVLSLFVSV